MHGERIRFMITRANAHEAFAMCLFLYILVFLAHRYNLASARKREPWRAAELRILWRERILRERRQALNTRCCVARYLRDVEARTGLRARWLLATRSGQTMCRVMDALIIILRGYVYVTYVVVVVLCSRIVFTSFVLVSILAVVSSYHLSSLAIVLASFGHVLLRAWLGLLRMIFIMTKALILIARSKRGDLSIFFKDL